MPTNSVGTSTSLSVRNLPAPSPAGAPCSTRPATTNAVSRVAHGPAARAHLLAAVVLRVQQPHGGVVPQDEGGAGHERRLLAVQRRAVSHSRSPGPTGRSSLAPVVADRELHRAHDRRRRVRPGARRSSYTQRARRARRQRGARSNRRGRRLNDPGAGGAGGSAVFDRTAVVTAAGGGGGEGPSPLQLRAGAAALVGRAGALANYRLAAVAPP